MSKNTNRDYLIILDVKSSTIKEFNKLEFYINDKESHNIFVQLVIKESHDVINKYAPIDDPNLYELAMNIVKPTNEHKRITGELISLEDGLYEFKLPQDCCDKVGTYVCELETIYNSRITNSNRIKYRIKKSVLNDLDGIVDAPGYPIVIQLLDKLSDIEQYEEDRRTNELARQLAEEQRQANELARQLAEEQRQARFDELNADIDNKMADVENRISAKEEAVDTLIADTKADIDDYKVAKDQEIDEYKVAKDQEIDEYKTAKDTEINNAITNQDNKIDTAISEQNDRISNAIATQDNKINTAINAQNDRITVVENNVVAQNDKLDTLETKATTHEARITATEAKDTEQDSRLDVAENRLANIGNDITNTMQPIIDGHTSRLDAIEAIDVAQNTRLDAIEVKNQQQDDRLLDVEKVNNRQDIDIKCLYGASQTIDVTKEGNSIYLQNSNNGFVAIDEIKGNTLVNCNKEPDKELILNGNINTSGDNAVTITEGVDGGLVDVTLEGNTLVNVSKTKDTTAITIAYTVENSGNHITLQGDVDGSCRPVITGNTLWIDNATGEVLTGFDETKSLRLQSTFEDNLVTQEMVDSGEEVADNLGKYRVDYKVTGKNLFDGETRNGYYSHGNFKPNQTDLASVNPIRVRPNTSYVSSGDTIPRMTFYDKDMNFLLYSTNQCNISPSNAYYMHIHGKASTFFQIEEDDTATAYEPYKEYTKTLYLNSPLLEGDTIEEKDGGIYHVHRSELLAYTEGDETSLITDKINTLHQLATPQYELIEQSNLEIPSYANGHLDFSTVVPVEKVEFKPFSEELTYLYANTQYTVQFISTKAILADINLGGTLLLSQSIVKGLNRISITTPKTLVNNKLIINGNDTGANIMEVIVTDIDRELIYFEGMKSVGEGKELQVISINSERRLVNTQRLTHEPLRGTRDAKDRYVLIDGKWYIERKCGIRTYQEGDEDTYKTDLINTVYPLEMPAYEEIDYSPLEVYSGTTRITTNSVIPTNITVKNHGYNCLLKPLTTYTISSNLGLNTVTTGADIGDSCLRFMDTDTSDVTTMRDVLVLEGDWTTKVDLIPTNFSGIESAFEQEYDEEKGKYKVRAKVVGKNLFSGYDKLINIIPNTNYYLSSADTIGATRLRFNLYDKDMNEIKGLSSSDYYYNNNGYYQTGTNKTIINFHLNTRASYIKIHYANSVAYNNIQLEQGTEATTYEPYKENYIEFYINEPLRGIGDVKDRVYVKDDKVVVERNCGSATLDGSDDENIAYSDTYDRIVFMGIDVNNTNTKIISSNGLCSIFTWNSVHRIGIKNISQQGITSLDMTKQWLQQNPTTVVYELAEPTYEEVEYNDVKLFIESFKNSTLFYNSNVPVTSKLYYSYSVPIVDTVARTASISDEQDLLLVNMATEIAIMQLTL